jgi:hypothetical protein
MAKDCLYCGLQFSDTTQFCPNCGRPAESGFSIRPLQEAELQRLCREVKEKDELIRQLALTRTMEGEAFRAAAHSTDRRDHYDSDGRRGDCPLEELKEGGYAGSIHPTGPRTELSGKTPLWHRWCIPRGSEKTGWLPNLSLQAR